jgi:iron complex transport system ATP-binding protein
MSLLSLKNGHVVTKGTTLLNDVSFDVAPGQMIGLLGPNGAGKTTALRAMMGLQPLTSGTMTFDGRDVTSLSAKQRARIAAYLPQTRMMAWPVCVREVVALGRFAHHDGLARLTVADSQAIEIALRDTDLTDLADRAVTSLSGGELARVHLARALVADTPALLVDEPTSALDPRHVFDTLARLQAKARGGVAVLVILHDLVAAAQFCDHIILLNSGKLVAQGPPDEVLSPAHLRAVYRIEAAWSGKRLQVLGPCSA